jgi:Trehalose and maltose hydrolases (possible phosphorylases)
LKQLDKIQVTKQADVVLLMLLFENDFPKDIIKKNWDYYEPKTTHDSSLSCPVHAILANDLGLYDKAFDYFEKSCETDLGVNMQSSIRGLHVASLSGIWKVIVEGFGGVRVVKNQLRIQPHIPSTWSSLRYSIVWRKNRVQVHVTHTNFSVFADEDLEFLYHDHTYKVAAGDRVTIAL